MRRKRRHELRRKQPRGEGGEGLSQAIQKTLPILQPRIQIDRTPTVLIHGSSSVITLRFYSESSIKLFVPSRGIFNHFNRRFALAIPAIPD
jgi:hypothetical protein